MPASDQYKYITVVRHIFTAHQLVPTGAVRGLGIALSLRIGAALHFFHAAMDSIHYVTPYNRLLSNAILSVCSCCSAVGVNSTRAATHVHPDPHRMAASVLTRPKGPPSRSHSVWARTTIRRSVTRCAAHNSGATLTVAPSIEKQWEGWHSGEREPYCIFESESDYNTFVRVLEVRSSLLRCACLQGMLDQGSPISRAAPRLLQPDGTRLDSTQNST